MDRERNNLKNESKEVQEWIRPAVEKMLKQAELAAQDKIESYSYEDVFAKKYING